MTVKLKRIDGTEKKYADVVSIEQTINNKEENTIKVELIREYQITTFYLSIKGTKIIIER